MNTHARNRLIGYVMGLLAGEGCFTTYGKQKPMISLKLHERDPKPLRALQSLLGGVIYGPYTHGTKPVRHYSMLLVRRPEELKHAVKLISKYLPESHKRAQFDQWRQTYRL